MGEFGRVGQGRSLETQHVQTVPERCKRRHTHHGNPTRGGLQRRRTREGIDHQRLTESVQLVKARQPKSLAKERGRGAGAKGERWPIDI